MNYREHATANARLVILRALFDETDYCLNETLIGMQLEAFGHRKPREYVRDQLRWLEQMGAVTISEVSGLMIAEITRKGLDHVEHRIIIENIARPSPEV